MRRGIADVGSNSLLLVVAERAGETWQEITETSVVTGLGAGTKQTRLLSQDAIQRTLEALAAAKRDADSLDAELFLFGTMALRIANNRDEFLCRAREQNTPVTVLSGEEEATLGALAVLEDPAFAGETSITVLDIGGHSTEVSCHELRGGRWECLSSASIPIGTLALRYGALSDESPDAGELLRASREIDAEVERFVPNGFQGKAVALGASATNLVTVRDSIVPWDASRVHLADLSFEEVSRFAGGLSRLGDAGRQALVGIEPGRETTLHIGALLLERLLYALRVERCTVSTKGWRHAMLGRVEEHFGGP